MDVSINKIQRDLVCYSGDYIKYKAMMTLITEGIFEPMSVYFFQIVMLLSA